MRVVAWDATEAFAVADALTVVIYLPAWIVAALGAIARRWLLTCAALAIIVAQVVLVAPELLAAAPVPQWTRGATAFRLLDANIDKSKEFVNGYSQAIDRFRPDLVTMEEFTPGSLRHLDRSEVLRQFPFECVAARYGPDGFLLASRIRMTGCRVHTVMWDGKATPYLVSASLHTEAGIVNLLVVHTLAPFPTYYPEWVTALRAIDNTVRNGATQRMLVVGDFNATWNNRGFAALVSDGLTDGAAARGRAFAMTWPNGALVPAFVRIDHVLTGRQLAVVDLATHPGYGSDHRYITATIAVRDRKLGALR